MSEPRIKLLPLHLANQIAAGEVVQRPESVVKELIENSLDAGATHITLIIAQAGKSVIQVIDNGSGMGEEDIPLAFERHATSKIQSYEDLEHIHTFGFRGEALPSIASVAQVEIKSRRAEDEIATVVRMNGGAVEEKSKAQGEIGTSITVKNLFFNTPARRQFLKSNTTEFRHIHDTFERYVLSYPEVRWTFVSEGETIFDVPPGNVQDHLAYIFGEKIASTMIAIQETLEHISVTGFISRPNFAKKNRGDQYLFLNTRYIIHRSLNHAVMSAYEQMIEQSEFPPFVIFLNLNPQEIDVNVHPSKLEVKFSNDRAVYNLVHAAVRHGLYKHDLTPSMTFRDNEQGSGFDKMRLTSPGEQQRGSFLSGDAPPFQQRTSPPQSRNTFSNASDRDARSVENIDRLFATMGFPEQGGSEQGGGKDASVLPVEIQYAETQYLWQLHRKYILTPIKSGLMIIDQHVAHERILYERALVTMENALPFAQQLLFPHTVRMTSDDYALVQDLEPELSRLGFVIKFSPPNFVTVDAVPQDVRVGMEERILEELIEQYREYQEIGTTEVRDALAKSYSCRSAIKAGDPMAPMEMQTLIDQLFATKVPYVCPHGRPIIIKLSLEDIDRKFGRTS